MAAGFGEAIEPGEWFDFERMRKGFEGRIGGEDRANAVGRFKHRAGAFVQVFDVKLLFFKAHGASGERFNRAAADAGAGDLCSVCEERVPGIERRIVFDAVDEIGVGGVGVEVGELMNEFVEIENNG